MAKKDGGGVGFLILLVVGAFLAFMGYKELGAGNKSFPFGRGSHGADNNPEESQGILDSLTGRGVYDDVGPLSRPASQKSSLTSQGARPLSTKPIRDRIFGSMVSDLDKEKLNSVVDESIK